MYVQLYFIKFNQKNKGAESLQVVVDSLNNEDKETRKTNFNIDDNNKTSFSMGMIHLMMHSLDPMTEGRSFKFLIIFGILTI